MEITEPEKHYGLQKKNKEQRQEKDCRSQKCNFSKGVSDIPIHRNYASFKPETHNIFTFKSHSHIYGTIVLQFTKSRGLDASCAILTKLCCKYRSGSAT